jgi:hypothetical protein
MKVYTKRLKDSHHFVTIEEKHRVLIMQRRYEISDEQWERIKEMFLRAKTGRPSKDSRLIFMPFSGLYVVEHPGGIFRSVLVHGRQFIPVSANGVMRVHFLGYLKI